MLGLTPLRLFPEGLSRRIYDARVKALRCYDLRYFIRPHARRWGWRCIDLRKKISLVFIEHRFKIVYRQAAIILDGPHIFFAAPLLKPIPEHDEVRIVRRHRLLGDRPFIAAIAVLMQFNAMRAALIVPPFEA